MRIRLIIPCYNEERRFPAEAFTRSLEELPDLFLLFVDDGSVDATADLLRTFCVEHPGRTELVVLDRNRGKAEAVRQGMLHAARQGGGFDYYGYFDADLAIPLNEAFLFFAFLQERRPVFILSGRVKLLGTTRIDRYLYRHLLGRVFATFVSWTLELAVYDTQCGAKLVRADMASTLFERPFQSRWLFDIELLYRCIALFGRAQVEEHVAEVPLRRLHDPGGSSVSFRHALRMPFELWRIRRAYSRSASGTK
ncbi:MAG: glycosyltransferase [Flavobacteriales bacterium]|nr:glycosyltransferase [Flavobacteriales bacterium]